MRALRESPESNTARMTSNRLLIVDDDPGVLTFLGEVGRGYRYDVALAQSVDELRACYDAFDPSLIVLDLQYAHGDGIEVMSFLKQHGCDAPIVLISGFDSRVLETARRVGLEFGLTIVDALVKPIRPDTLGGVLNAHREPEAAEWADDLRAAIDRDDLMVCYQPKVQVADGRLIGFEALARWRHPSRGAISPERFVPLAETTGLIRPLTAQVLDRAVRDRASWAVTGHDLTVAVNLSPLLLTDDHLLPGPDPSPRPVPARQATLTLEVTESAAMRNPAVTLEILSRLRLRGFNLALDDFGTGYSNLAMLHRMPFNELKIDRSFVADVSASRDSQVIVAALAGLARQLGLTTVAEGVEDLDTWAWLRSVGVEQIQGFGIARPMPAELVVDWIGSYKPPRVDRPVRSDARLRVPEAERRHHVRGRERLDQRHRRAEAGLANAQDVLLIRAHQDRDRFRVAVPDQAGHLDAAEPGRWTSRKTWLKRSSATASSALDPSDASRTWWPWAVIISPSIARWNASSSTIRTLAGGNGTVGRRAGCAAIGPCLGGGGGGLMGADAVGPAQQRERPPDLLGPERLGDHRDREGVASVERHEVVGVGADHDEDRARVARPGPPQQLDAVHRRHPEVGEDQADRLLAQHVERFEAVAGLQDPETGVGHVLDEDRAHAGVVVDHEDRVGATRIGDERPPPVLDGDVAGPPQQLDGVADGEQRDAVLGGEGRLARELRAVRQLALLDPPPQISVDALVWAWLGARVTHRSTSPSSLAVLAANSLPNGRASSLICCAVTT